jgi:recombination protein RecT
MSNDAPAKPAEATPSPNPLALVKDKLTKFLPEIARAMPPGTIKPERFLRVVLNAISNQPKLAECTWPSLYLACMRAAQLGLECDGLLGHAYIIPYWNKHLRAREANFQVGYQGMIVLAMRSGLVEAPIARAVRERDKFQYYYGLKEDRFRHVPYDGGDPGEITKAYSIIRLKEGAPLLTVYSREKIERDHKSRSRAAESEGPIKGPWETDYEAMVIKTMLRVGLKYAPKSVETPEAERLQRAIKLDEAAEFGIPIDLSPDEAKLIGAGDRQAIETTGITAADVFDGVASGRNDAKPSRECKDHGAAVERAKTLPPSRSIVCPGCAEDIQGTLQEAPPAAGAPATDAGKTKGRGKSPAPAAEPATQAPAPSAAPAPGPVPTEQDDLFGS